MNVKVPKIFIKEKIKSIKEKTYTRKIPSASITRDKKNDNCSVKVTTVKKKKCNNLTFKRHSTIILDLIKSKDNEATQECSSC